MLSQTINHEDTDLLGYPLVTEVYKANSLSVLYCLIDALDFKHNHSSERHFEVIGMPDRSFLLTYKFYDYDCREKIGKN